MAWGAPSGGGLVKRWAMLPSAAYTAAATVLSDWVDSDEFNELYVWWEVTAFAARADETAVLTVERQADNAAGYVTIATFTTKNSTGTASEEETVTSLIGGKVRCRLVLAGTWSSKSMTLYVKAMMKSA